MDCGVLDVAQQVEDISGQATGESNIEQQCQQIEALWNETYFIVIPYRDMKDRYIIGTIEDVMTQLEDH